MTAIDFTAMYAMHDALRRELEHLDRITSRADVDARQVLATAAGWQLFKKALHVHHTAEDDALWPVLRARLADSPEDLALLEAMAAEHAAIDPFLEAIDALIAASAAQADPLRLGELVDALITGLSGHLKHEEDAALPLIARSITIEEWLAFGQVHAQRIGPDAPRLLPWLLDGADEQTTQALLAPLLDPARGAYAAVWLPAYTALDRWSPATSS